MPVQQKKALLGAAAITIKLVFPNVERQDTLLDTGVYRVGSGDEAEIRFLSPTMPSVAAELHVSGRYVDLHPQPKTEITINGGRVSGVVALKNGDHLQIAGISIRVEKILTGPEPLAANDGVASHPDVQSLLQNLPSYVLRSVSGLVPSRAYPIHGGLIIGRNADCHIRVDTPYVSHRHASLKLTVQGAIVEDLGSKNGVFINDRLVRTGILRVGDELRLGGVAFLLCSEAPIERCNNASELGDVERLPQLRRGFDWFTVGLLGIFEIFLIAVSFLTA